MDKGDTIIAGWDHLQDRVWSGHVYVRVALERWQ